MSHDTLEESSLYTVQISKGILPYISLFESNKRHEIEHGICYYQNCKWLDLLVRKSREYLLKVESDKKMSGNGQEPIKPNLEDPTSLDNPNIQLTPAQYAQIYNTQKFLDDMDDETLFQHINLMKLILRNGNIELKHAEDIVISRRNNGTKERKAKISELDKKYQPDTKEVKEKKSKADKLMEEIAKTLKMSEVQAREFLERQKTKNVDGIDPIGPKAPNPNSVDITTGRKPIDAALGNVPIEEVIKPTDRCVCKHLAEDHNADHSCAVGSCECKEWKFGSSV